MIIKYLQFIIESIIRDIFTSNVNTFDNHRITKFINDVKLIDYVVIKYNDKILKIEWNNYKGHEIIEKIEKRTTLKSVSEWN